jgi:hypothetical protein
MNVSGKQTRQGKISSKRQRELEAQARLVDTRLERKRHRGLLAAIVAVPLVLAVGVLAALAQGGSRVPSTDLGRRSPDTTSVGYPSQGNDHLRSATQPHVPYNSNPPSSGPHMPNLAPSGWHEEPIQQELLVHNLEDGYIVVHYKPTLDPARKAELQALVEQLGEKTVAAPNPQIDTDIALAAWTRVDKYNITPEEGVNELRIRNFATAYQGLDHHKQ